MRRRLGSGIGVHVHSVAKVLGIFLFFYSLSMLVPPLVGLFLEHESPQGSPFNPMRGFLLSTLVGCVFGGGLFFWGRRGKGEFFRKEGILVVASIWIFAGLIGALPYLFSGALDYASGVFETTSGLTTTGSSTLGSAFTPRISSLPKSLLFWRAQTHWMGGLGIVVMFLVFLPALGITEKTLFQAEVPGVSKEGLRPRIRQSAQVLFWIYSGITVALVFGFLYFGMNTFEAVCHSFATIATGGFSTRDFSVGEFGSLGVEWVAIFGMIIAGTNFGLYYKLGAVWRRTMQRSRPLQLDPLLDLDEQRVPKSSPLLLPLHWLRRLPTFFKKGFQVFAGDPEFRFYLLTFVIGGLLIAGILWAESSLIDAKEEIGRLHDYGNLGECLRDSSFQTASLISSTGFANSNLLTWPLLAQGLLVLIMLGGACGGSTGGGLKAARVLILFKLLGRTIRKFLKPRSVEPLRLGGGKLEQEVIDSVLALFVAWILILGAGSILVLALEPNLDAYSSFTSVVTCLNNMGPGFTALVPGPEGSLVPANRAGIDISSYGSFGSFAASTKYLLSLIMIFGRLEVYAPLAILLPSFWREN